MSDFESQNIGSGEDGLLRSALGPTPECPPLEMLESLDAKGRAHVEGCAWCSNELAMLTEFQAVDVRPEEAASVAWIESELARRAAPAPVAAKPAESLWSRIQSWMGSWQMVPVAVAALLLVMAGGMYLRQGNEGLRPVPHGEQVWRSQSFRAIAPVGDVAAAPAEFQWEAVPGAAKYRVRVTEVDRTEIWRSETPDTRSELPAVLRAQMTAGRSFQWTAAALDASGRTISETGLQSFHILTTSR
jgi:hypothetical protein